jgi:phosphoribosylamine--glycine ligase
MRILLVGGGGREHALAWRLGVAGHRLCFTHANPGFEPLGPTRAGDPVDIARAERVDLVVIGPEAPLAEGLVDRLDAAGVPAFGPRADAAWLESSKSDAKAFCVRHRLPTARAVTVAAGEPLEWSGPGVVKLDGLAGGKGVWVCGDEAAVRSAVRAALRSRPEERVLVEERLEGPEVSVLAISDGTHVVPLLAARDHKRRYDGDLGPNTGGMGAVAPVVSDTYDTCVDVLRRSVLGMASEGTPFRGVLYGGFMLTPQGPKLLEFNVRFGDPECQPLMTLLDEDPAPWFLGAATGRLPGDSLRWRAGAACCVVVTGEGYPERPADAVVEALPAETADLLVFHAGTKRVGGRLRASGGRVLGVTGLGPTLEAARERAYAGVAGVRFAGAAWRTDIGSTAS